MEQDRLSNLPKFILHDILSRLSTKYAARTSLLSKTWAEIWSTFPILSFSDTEIIGRRMNFIELEDCIKRKRFCDYVERTLLKFHNQGLAIKQFKLTVNNFQDMLKDVDIWLKLATESGVEVVELCEHYHSCIRNEVHDQCYILPTSVLETKSLTKLVLLGRIGIDRSFMNHPMKFFSLQVLTLEGVCSGDEHALKHLISRCPLIEYITLGTCPRRKIYHTNNSCMKSLSLHGLSRLKSLDVQGIQEVNVDAPCLENLCYLSCKSLAPCKIDFNRCRSLKRLCLSYLDNTIITNNWFLELSLKFHFLERLEFNYCTMPQRIRISSDRLKVLVLSYCSNLEEINIVAPNLLSCSYSVSTFRSHDGKPAIFFLGCSNQLVVNVHMAIQYQNFCNFRKFIQNFKSQTVLASIVLFIPLEIAVELESAVLQVSSPPPSIKHLRIHVFQNIPNNEALYLSLVNRLLSNCCPATITFILDSQQCSKAYIEVLYKTLMGINKDKCFCRSSHTKCWWHDLKGVKVISPMMIAENVDFKTMLETRKISARPENIMFKLIF